MIITKKGALHVAKASPEGYREIANTQLFEDHSWTPASFANGKIYARSMKEIAAVEVLRKSQVAAIAAGAKKEGILPNSGFAQFVKKAEATGDKKALIDQFMEENSEFPIIEGERMVHIVYRGEAEDIVIGGDMIGFRREDPMNRIAGTDFYYYSFELEPDSRIDYRFIKNFDETIADPLNPRKIRSLFGESAWLAMPKWNEPSHYQKTEGITTGHLDSLHLESSILDSRKLDVYLPAGYENSEKRYPVVYILSGGLAISMGQMANTLDNLTGNEIEPVITVFIAQSQKRQDEFGGDLVDQYAQMLAEEVVPLIDKTYRTIPMPEARLSYGTASSGYMAFYAAFKHPGVFGNVASQSIVMLNYNEDILKPLVKTASEQPLNIYIDWGKYDIRAEHEGWNMATTNRDWAAFLGSKGYQPAGGEAHDGFGWSSWKNRTDTLLKTFFAKAE